jgi:hypothetical protein
LTYYNMKTATRRFLVSFLSFSLVYLAVFLIPVLIQSGRISELEGLILVMPLSVIIAYVFLRFGSTQRIRQFKLRIFTIVSVLVYAFLGPVVYILSAHNAVGRLISFVPVDTVIFAVPAFLLYRMGKPAILNPDDYSQEYTDRLQGLVGDAGDHDVYISRKRIFRSYAETSKGKSWHVMLNQEAIQQLDADEIDAAMLDAYYSRKYGTARKIIILGALYVAVAVDILLAASILLTIVPASYDLLILSVTAASVIMIAAIPFFILFLTSRLQGTVDREVLRHIPSSDSFISAIKKKSTLMRPLRPMSQKQMMRYERRISRITEKRMDRIRNFSEAARKG